MVGVDNYAPSRRRIKDEKNAPSGSRKKKKKKKSSKIDLINGNWMGKGGREFILPDGLAVSRGPLYGYWLATGAIVAVEWRQWTNRRTPWSI